MRIARGNDIDLGMIAANGRHLILPADARSLHVHVCGGTGVGKSKFLEHLIRQDIIAWPKSKCGLLLLDPHGSLYDNTMAWLARHGLNRPIIPIDLRRDDWVVSYNLLRRRSVANASVVVDGIIEAMAYVWGQGGTDETPQFARWAGNILHTLYENHHSLVESISLLDDRAIRKKMTHALKDRLSNRDWKMAGRLNEKDFEDKISSTVNRLHRFLRNEHLRAILGQTDRSLDLSDVLEDGHIVLVSLALAKAKVSKENSELFATLLLSDLWTAAQERGKPRDAGDVRPFYVYLDEFQRFITPTISENLDEARGFGLHLTMAHQFPKQLRDAGDQGRRLYNSVMENATTKVVFRLTDEENLRPLAQWLFMGVMNADEIKHELYSTKVMKYQEEYREAYSRTRGAGRSTTHTVGGSSGKSLGTSEGESYMEPDPRDVPGLFAAIVGAVFGLDPENERRKRLNKSISQTESQTENESMADQFSENVSQTVTRNTVLIPQMGKELSHVQFRSLQEQLHRAMAALFDQQQRQCVARIGDRMRAPVSLLTPTILGSLASLERIDRYTVQQFKRWPFFSPMAEAVKALADREQLIKLDAYRSSNDESPTARRKINPPEDKAPKHG